MENDSPIRIALVDDHLKLRTAIAEYLKNFKYKVIWQAANGIEALEAIERHTEKPHVCILDINMPEMDGIETAKQLTLHFPMVKILAFNGNGDDASVLQMLKARVKGYLLKGGEAIEIKRASRTSIGGWILF